MTHPFHPLAGREFTLVTQRVNWGEDRAYYQDETGKLCAIPARWTSLGPLDPGVELSAGKAAFRAADLEELAGLVKGMLAERGASGSPGGRSHV